MGGPTLLWPMGPLAGPSALHARLACACLRLRGRSSARCWSFKSRRRSCGAGWWQVGTLAGGSVGWAGAT